MCVDCGVVEVGVGVYMFVCVLYCCDEFCSDSCLIGLYRVVGELVELGEEVGDVVVVFGGFLCQRGVVFELVVGVFVRCMGYVGGVVLDLLVNVECVVEVVFVFGDMCELCQCYVYLGLVVGEGVGFGDFYLFLLNVVGFV